jgi:hypothetical protein
MKKTKAKKILPKNKLPNTTLKEKQRPLKIDYKEHWKGMPEFVAGDKQPIKQVLVGFANKEDMLRFSKLVGQEITAKTRSIWFPAVDTDGAINKRYTDIK